MSIVALAERGARLMAKDMIDDGQWSGKSDRRVADLKLGFWPTLIWNLGITLLGPLTRSTLLINPWITLLTFVIGLFPWQFVTLFD